MDHVASRPAAFTSMVLAIRQRQSVGRLLSCNHRLSLQGSDLRHFPAMGATIRVYSSWFRGVNSRGWYV